MASAIGVPPAIQALPLEGFKRTSRCLVGNVGSSLALPPSSFFGDRGQLGLCPCSSVSLIPNSVTRIFLSSCLRRDPSGSRPQIEDGLVSWMVDGARTFHSSDSHQSSTAQTSAVVSADYAVAGEETEVVGVRRRGPLERQGGFLFPQSLDDNGAIGKVEEDADSVGGQLGGPELTTLNLKRELVSALASRSITRLFPIQEAVLKPAMEGRDIIGRAKTGTGKTLAFGIPIIQGILQESDQNISLTRQTGRNPRALVLAPTRELAVQVEKEFMESAPFLSTICVYGGVSITAQQRKLWKGVDVAVGTPGRIIDLIERGYLNLKDVRYMVLDEADQMLAVGFEQDVERILEELPKVRQSMLFSATMPTWVKQLSRKYLNNPLTIDLVGESDEKLADNIKLYAVPTVGDAKRSILNDLITVYARGGKTIVFTQTKKDANDISLSMGRMHGCEALHGDITQMQREKTLNAFRNGSFSVLVATDVAARGLDIPNVDLIIHYDIPNDPETFVHRSGRTGRAGKAGIAILMHTCQQKRTVKLIERDAGCKFEEIAPPNALDVLRASSDQAREHLTKVHPELKDAFLSTAEALLKEQGPEVLAAAIAYMSGFTRPPASRSLISHEEGWMTLQITRSGRDGGPLSSARSVMGTLASIYRSAADKVGKIYILDDREGAVFDLPEDVAKELLTKEAQPGDSIEVATKLPGLEDDSSMRDNYGRFSSRGGNRSFRGDRSAWGPRSRRPDERVSSWNDDKRYSRRQDERSTSWNDDFGRSKFEVDRKVTRSMPFSRDVPFSRDMPFSRDRAFSGACYVCGQPGHRATECPMERSR